jgi:serine/threonine protein phosphatase 1
MRWIIGDIHGMRKSLEGLISEVRRVDRQAMLYFVGDYVNRGKESKGVIETLLTLDNARFLRGNHDDILDQILHGVSYAENPSRGDRFLAYQWFLEHGLLETLLSYGATHDMIYRVVSNRSQKALEPIIDLFPPEHRTFIRSLPIYIDDDDLFVVHGKWPLNEPEMPSALLGTPLPVPTLRHEALWGRYSEFELTCTPTWSKRGFFGHTPVQTYTGHENNSRPIVLDKLVLMDTAAALVPHGRLTAICAETMQAIQTDQRGKVVTVE